MILSHIAPSPAKAEIRSSVELAASNGYAGARHKLAQVRVGGRHAI